MMSNKPIFVATHPRSCSTAFERAFMTRRDELTCVHEPFGDAFYFGPERLSERYEADEIRRMGSGFSQSTYKVILDGLMNRANEEGKRLFIKDMVQYLVPPDSKPASIAPSLARKERGIGTKDEITGDLAGSAGGTTISRFPDNNVSEVRNRSLHGSFESDLHPYPRVSEHDNPTIIPDAILKRFHFTFLIRHPRSSIPSYYRCTIPPLNEVTGFHEFMPSEAGYIELRRTFDYLRSTRQIGPRVAGAHQRSHDENGHFSNGHIGNGHPVNGNENTNVEICVVDADDLLDNPEGIIQAYCKSIGLSFDKTMLSWHTAAEHQSAKQTFEKWIGFHDDAIHSTDLKPRTHKKRVFTDEEENASWIEKFGGKGAKIIRETVDANIAHYEHLKQFALRATDV